MLAFHTNLPEKMFVLQLSFSADLYDHIFFQVLHLIICFTLHSKRARQKAALFIFLIDRRILRRTAETDQQCAVYTAHGGHGKNADALF